MTTYGYVRVSTSRQVDEGESLNVQQRKIQGYAMQHGWSCAQVFRDEGVSGSTCLDKRVEGGKLLNYVKSGDVIVASKLDRLFRSALDALTTVKELDQRGVALHLLDLGGDVSGKGTARLFFTMVSAFAEFERERIAERIREVKSDQRSRNRYLGGSRPKGMRILPGGELVEDPRELAQMAKIRRYREQGLSLREIALRMRKLGVEMHLSTVRRLLNRPERKAVSG